MRSFENTIRVAVTACLASYGAGALAQTAAEDSASTGGAAALETVTVTAQRREENLQSVPIAVTALSSDALSQMGVATTQDLQVAVPGLVYSQSGGRSQAYLRGVGNNISSEGVDASVATYIDGVYVASTASTIVGLLGVDRIEVLKGPQGTLYGRNATGGAISVITRSPSDHFEGDISLGYGNYDRQEATLFLGGPVTDTLRVSLDAGGTRRDPYMTPSPFPPTATNLPDLRDEESEVGGRVKVLYDPTEWLSLTLSGDYVEYRSYEDMAWRQLQSNATGFANGAVPNPDRYGNSTTNPLYSMFDAAGLSLRADFDLGSSKIMWLSGGRDVTFEQSIDADATTWRPNGTVQHSESKSISHELQWLSSDDSTWQWVVGAFYYNQEARANPNRSLNANFLRVQDQWGELNTESISGFAQATIPLGQRWRTTLGARYTEEKKDVQGVRQTYNPTTQAPLVTEVNPLQEKEWSEFTPKVVVDYTIEDTMIYASYSRGFKSGVFSVGSPTAPAVNPELLDAYEVGLKSEFFDNRVRLNSSIFFYDYEDLQVQNRVPDPNIPGNSNLALQNAANAEIQGADVEIQFAATRDLTLNASATYLDSEYLEFPNFNGYVPAAVGNQAGSINVTGNRLARVADWSGTLGGRYEWELNSGAEVNFTASWYYNSGYNFLPDNSISQDRYDTTTASIQFVPSRGPWSVLLWGKNLTSQYYYNFQQIIATGTQASPAAPRTYGVSFTWDFAK